MPFCNSCGKKVSEDDEVCPTCGKKLKLKYVRASLLSIDKKEFVLILLSVFTSVYITQNIKNFDLMTSSGIIIFMIGIFVTMIVGIMIIGLLYMAFDKIMKYLGGKKRYTVRNVVRK